MLSQKKIFKHKKKFCESSIVMQWCNRYVNLKTHNKTSRIWSVITGDLVVGAAAVVKFSVNLRRKFVICMLYKFATLFWVVHKFTEITNWNDDFDGRNARKCLLIRFIYFYEEPVINIKFTTWMISVQLLSTLVRYRNFYDRKINKKI